ncbi:MAG: NHLP leader peptide family RiPP precursor [Rubrobacteraceae bacterium]
MTEAGDSPGDTPEQMRQRLVQRSVEDEELRQRLLDDPKATVEQEIGTSLPEEVEVRAIEESQDTVYLVLPPKPPDTTGSGELSDQELESVSGGWLSYSHATHCCVTSDC